MFSSLSIPAYANRQSTWAQLHQSWDVLVIGGGITGAGILHLAAQAGLRALLVEAHDFASGTSSRSSKLVHGGLRYLKNAQLKLTLESVHEREALLRQGRGLVNRLGFIYAALAGDAMPGAVFGLGLILYDLMARQWTHRAYDLFDLRELCPPLDTPALRGGYRYFDAQTDDARLVLRLVQESTTAGATALNYARVDHLLRLSSGQVCGVTLTDTSGDTSNTVDIQASVVINATGAWADSLRAQLGQRPRLRPLRGSHIVLPFARLPLTRAVSFSHPRDGRPVFALPWEGVILFGTTDVDHKTPLQTDPALSQDEFDYLLSALQHVFPGQGFAPTDVLSTYSGLRPVVNTGQANPSKESREHVLWEEDGLLTVSGGKLTTFRLMARDALRRAHRQVKRTGRSPVSPGWDRLWDPTATNATILDPLPAVSSFPQTASLSPAMRLRLAGRYGAFAPGLVADGTPANLQSIPGTPYLWQELAHAAANETVVHLDDLLLRRLRLGLLLPQGGIPLIPQIQPMVQPLLGWTDSRWRIESAAYANLWHTSYAPK